MEVYKITCKINNKIYIGSTKLSKEKRWGDLSSSSSHLSCVRKEKKYQTTRAIDKCIILN